MRTFDEIIYLIQDMQRVQGPVLLQMREILDRYDGEWVLPMPDVANEPNLPPLTPALVGEAVDAMAMRASSVKPRSSFPAIQPDKRTGKRSAEYANIRRKIVSATYHESKWGLGRRRFYRHMSAYHTGALVVMPDFKSMLPRLEVRDPLSTYSEPQANETLCAPKYVCFINRHSGQKLRAMFPKVRNELGGPISDRDVSELWDVFEWFDEDQLMMGLLGPVKQGGFHLAQQHVGAPWMQLTPTVPNKAGRCLALTPQNVSLGKIASRIGSLLGNVDLQAKLMALDILAQEKAIFPDMYVLGRRDGGMPTVLGGEWKDGRTGEMNIIVDAESIGMLRSTPDQRTQQLIDRMERNFRTSTGLVPQFGGETYGALRTGRGIDALANIAVDPRIQEMHEISEAWMPHVNGAILDCYTGWWPTKKYTMFSGWPGDRGMVEFTPNEHIEQTENTVAYPVPGADIIQLTQILGSMLGARGISLDTFRAMHPWIADPDDEREAVRVEQFEDALQQALLQQLTQGQLPLTAASMLVERIRKGDDLFDAMTAVNKRMQEIQATEAPPAPEGMAAPPEAMPGMAGGPGAMQQQMPPEAMAPTEAGPAIEPGDVNGMRQLMQAMAAQ